ncbi:MAG: serine/threonine protein kinase [Myxococcota bacterium]
MSAALHLDVLRSQLRSLPDGEIDRLARRFAKERGGDDTDFVAWLHSEGRISGAELRDAIASLDVVFTLSEATLPDRPRHRVLGLLGKGAMGEVHVARDEELHRNVALKRLDPRLAGEPVLIRRFMTEAQITAQLDHPGVVPVYGVERPQNGLPSYTMKLVRGKTLKEYLADAKAFYDRGEEPDEAHGLAKRLELFVQICEPVGYANDRGVVHRDLKPDNIMVGPHGEVFVMDWGIARLIGGEESVAEVEIDGGRAERTQFGMVIGTPSYMSPEQAEGRNDDMDGRSDLFTLGIILFELVTLRRARAGLKPAQTLLAAQAGRIDPIKHVSPREKVPRELAAIIRKATQKRRRDRYQTVEELAAEIRRYLRGDAVLAQPDTGMQRLARWIALHRDTSAAIGLALVLLVFVVVVFAVTGGLAALEISRDAAARREARLADVLAVVSGQARAMDRTFQRYEGLLHGLAFTAERVLASPPERRPVHLVDDYLAERVPGLFDSTVYDGKITLDHVDFALAPGVSPKSVETRLWQLAALQPYFKRALLQSHDEGAVTLDAAAQRALIGETGTPVVWTYVALEEGIIAALPGTGVYPEAYDPRKRPWYDNADDHRLPHWGSVYGDESGMGLLLDCGTGIYDPGGKLLGVAALDITVGYLVDTMLDAKGLPAEVEAYLVGEDGKIVVQSSLKEKAKDADYEPAPLPWPQVVDAVRGGTRSGHAELGGELLVWTRLDAVPWTYLVVGKSDELLGG